MSGLLGAMGGTAGTKIASLGIALALAATLACLYGHRSGSRPDPARSDNTQTRLPSGVWYSGPRAGFSGWLKLRSGRGVGSDERQRPQSYLGLVENATGTRCHTAGRDAIDTDSRAGGRT